MTKRLGIIFGLVLVAVATQFLPPREGAAGNGMAVAPITLAGTPYAVSVSTFAYTNVTPTTVRLARQNAVLIDNPSTNSYSMHGHLGNCTSTAISTSTVKGPIEIAPSSNGGYIAIAEDYCLWLVSRNPSAAESVTVQGVTEVR